MTAPPDEGPEDVAGLFALERAWIQAWRLLSNNLPPADQRQLRLTGDPALTTILRRTRAIIGSPV